MTGLAQSKDLLSLNNMKYVYITARRDAKSRYKKYKLYHLSPVDLPPISKMIPRVPKNWMTEKGYEDGTVARISFAPSIGKCLSAMTGLCVGKKLRVYALDYIPKGRKPSKKQVPDVDVTQEYWVTETIENPIYLGTIQITKEKPNTFVDVSTDPFMEDSPDWFSSDITEQEFVNRFYSKNPAKGKAVYKMHTGDKKRGREYKMGDRTVSAYDYGWRWIKREKN